MILSFDTAPDKIERMIAAVHPCDGAASPVEEYGEWNEGLLRGAGELQGEGVILIRRSISTDRRSSTHRRTPLEVLWTPVSSTWCEGRRPVVADPTARLSRGVSDQTQHGLDEDVREAGALAA